VGRRDLEARASRKGQLKAEGITQLTTPGGKHRYKQQFENKKARKKNELQ
jgi:hypothetical protein